MGTIWGPITEIKDVGVVAEQCPHCGKITPCLLRSVYKGSHVFFVRMTTPTREASSLCTVCIRAFPCEAWRYSNVVSIREAKTLQLEELQARTNPGLAERLEWKEQVRALGGDDRFAVAYEHLEGMRPGALHTRLMKALLQWDQLGEEQKAQLLQQITAWSRAWQFARQIGLGFPAQAGCFWAGIAALVVWSAFLWLPPVRDWLWGTIVVVAGCGAAALTGHALLGRRVRQWTRQVLVPEAEEANVSLDCFVTVIDDLPGSRLGMIEELWPVKDQLDTIRGVLAAEGKLK